VPPFDLGERVACQLRRGCPEDGIRPVELLGGRIVLGCPYHVDAEEARVFRANLDNHLAHLAELARSGAIRLQPSVAEQVRRRAARPSDPPPLGPPR
jgi:hypothetical protein